MSYHLFKFEIHHRKHDEKLQKVQMLSLKVQDIT